MKLKDFLLLLVMLFTYLDSPAQADRYIKIIQNESGKPLDSFEVSFCTIHGCNFEFIGYSTTDTNGLVRVPVSFGVDTNFFGSFNVNPPKFPKDHNYYQWERKYVTGIMRDTTIIPIHKLRDD